MLRYQSAGIYDIVHDFYRGGRHEMLNETNRAEVRRRLLGWMDTVLYRGRHQAPSLASATR